jgi:hypothetical protein
MVVKMRYNFFATVHLATPGWLRLCGKVEMLIFGVCYSWLGGIKFR